MKLCVVDVRPGVQLVQMMLDADAAQTTTNVLRGFAPKKVLALKRTNIVSVLKKTRVSYWNRLLTTI